MKKFKQIDLMLQIAAMVVLTVLSLINLDYTFIVAYFIIGGIQSVSMFVHFAENTMWTGIRKGYSITSLCIILCMLLGFIMPVFFFIFYIMNEQSIIILSTLVDK